MNKLQKELVQTRINYLDMILEQRRNDFRYGQDQLVVTRQRIEKIVTELVLLREDMEETE